MNEKPIFLRHKNPEVNEYLSNEGREVQENSGGLQEPCSGPVVVVMH